MRTVTSVSLSVGWYDNEMGYVHTLVEHVLAAVKHLS